MTHLTADRPVLEDEVVGYPQRLFARYLFWRVDAQRASIFGDARIAESKVLDAVDLILSAELDGSYLALISTRAEADLHVVVAAIREALADDGQLHIDFTARTALHLESPDFYLWFLHRLGTDPQLEAGYEIASTTGLDVIDRRSRVNSLRDDVDDSRSAYLTAVVDRNVFGPARFTLRNRAQKSRVTLSLWLDGSFAVIVSETHYSAKAAIPNERLAAVQDLAYVLIPMLVRIYRDDAAWFEGGREEYREAARSSLAARYALEARDSAAV